MHTLSLGLFRRALAMYPASRKQRSTAAELIFYSLGNFGSL